MILITLPDGTLINLDIGLVVVFALATLGGFAWGFNWILKRRLPKE